MRKKVSEIDDVPYVAKHGEEKCDCTPSPEEIDEAVRRSDFDTRGFQTHKSELDDEWNNGHSMFEEYCKRSRLYHARRIAYFVTHKWSEPIILKVDQRSIHDGLHRLKAAKHLGLETVYVRIE